ncbi:hypothetical protein T552_02477 [Pneumocystis carinii B80]|uniref:Large ribosomal subunit protein uL6 alpha-beta domain-containing protein n=1 Tax=Pneumocystis carinii (strain B80) TaxID=1408658 RepID=A0A0W4ZFA3_PNEC8|nr:hypothetical protein T552_02477 [Pneumocystis carinii B80]KTW26986.1 hypothetical protein T552_02477 [Pneumocystis carinii B80]
MKDICKQQELVIPDNVKVDIKARVVIVTGPRGLLKQNFRHINIDIRKTHINRIKLTVWHGGRKHVACLRTVKSLINNMITGVTRGYRYKMRFVYAHFPINVSIGEEGKLVEIRNFLGEKVVRRVAMLEGVKVELSKSQKDEIILEGISLENVSQSAASIQQICNVRNKDIRKFLDGIYVSARETIEED